MSVGQFLDIEGAFNCTLVDAIRGAMNRHGLDDTTIRWVNNMLTSRLLMVDREEGTLKVAIKRGSSQGRGHTLTSATVSSSKRPYRAAKRGRDIYPGICGRHSGRSEGYGC